MKPRHYIALALACVGTAISMVLLTRPRPLPASECSEVYRRYCDTSGISASYLEDYPLDDSTTIAVTLLQAQDSATWAETVISLCCNNNHNDYTPGEIKLYPIKKANADQLPDSAFKNEYIVISYFYDLTIGIFKVENKDHQKIIIDHYIELLTKKNKDNETNY